MRPLDHWLISGEEQNYANMESFNVHFLRWSGLFQEASSCHASSASRELHFRFEKASAPPGQELLLGEIGKMVAGFNQALNSTQRR